VLEEMVHRRDLELARFTQGQDTDLRRAELGLPVLRRARNRNVAEQALPGRAAFCKRTDGAREIPKDVALDASDDLAAGKPASVIPERAAWLVLVHVHWHAPLWLLAAEPVVEVLGGVGVRIGRAGNRNRQESAQRLPALRRFVDQQLFGRNRALDLG